MFVLLTNECETILNLAILLYLIWFGADGWEFDGNVSLCNHHRVWWKRGVVGAMDICWLSEMSSDLIKKIRE